MTEYPQPTIIIDTREQHPLPIAGPTVRRALTSGDYSFVGGELLFTVERKTLADLVQSLTSERDRFTRELERLRGYRFARLLVVGDPEDLAAGNYRSQARPQAMVASLHSIEARFIPVVWSPTPEAAAQLLARWVYWSARDLLRAAEDVRKSVGGLTAAEP
jgi:ERCC4-type nuclease